MQRLDIRLRTRSEHIALFESVDKFWDCRQILGAFGDVIEPIFVYKDNQDCTWLGAKGGSRNKHDKARYYSRLESVENGEGWVKYFSSTKSGG